MMNQFEPTLSYTFLSAYQKCHRRAWLQYVKKVVPVEKVNQRPFIVGTCADFLFKKWVAGGYKTDWMEKEARGIFEWFSTKRAIRYLDSADKEKLILKLTLAVRDLQQAALDEKFPERVLHLQKELRVNRNQFIMSGKLDIWFPEEKAIYDLKITASTKYLDSFQLRYFAWLIEHKYLVFVEKLMFLSPLMRPYLREVSWLPSDKTEFDLLLFDVLTKIESNDWSITTKDCWSCPVASFCEEFTVEAEREKSASGGFKISVGGKDGGIEEEL